MEGCAVGGVNVLFGGTRGSEVGAGEKPAIPGNRCQNAACSLQLGSIDLVTNIITLYIRLVAECHEGTHVGRELFQERAPQAGRMRVAKMRPEVELTQVGYDVSLGKYATMKLTRRERNMPIMGRSHSEDSRAYASKNLDTFGSFSLCLNSSSPVDSNCTTGISKTNSSWYVLFCGCRMSISRIFSATP